MKILAVDSRYISTQTIEVGNTKYRVFELADSTYEDLKLQIVGIHPYDDAEYVWANIENGKCYFILNGKRISNRPIEPFTEGWYEDDNEYLNDIVIRTCKELNQINADIEPIIVHD